MVRQPAILILAGIIGCFIVQTPCSGQYTDIDEETGCPLNVDHKCNFCANEQGNLGCYCELDDGEQIITSSIFTPCPSKTLPCDTNPCSNGGTCVPSGLTDYRCMCAPGYYDVNCTEVLTKCTDTGISCLNGECIETNDPLLPVYCACFDGARRDPRKNETCPLSPCYVADTETPVCQNNATCRIFNNNYICECKENFVGVNCSKSLKQPWCSDHPGICGAGKCQQSSTPPFYTCTCGSHPSIFGRNITDLYKCEDSGCYAVNPCQNGGTCANKGKGGFRCQCPPRFTGSKCEKNSACFSNPCINGGICEAYNETLYFCKCPPYYSGLRCESVLPDPCKTVNCGPHGICRDSNGRAICACHSNITNIDGSPCPDPCRNKTCDPGVCVKKQNSTYDTVCSCPIDRTGEFCEKPRDPCREKPRCGGGYCKPNYQSPRGYSCVCEGGVVKNEPCPFPKNCQLSNCGNNGTCVETDGIKITPDSKPIYYVCLCKNGYIHSDDCDSALDSKIQTAIGICGTKGKPYPSRNPNNPVGCWCNNGTHIEEIAPSFNGTYCQ